MSVRQV